MPSATSHPPLADLIRHEARALHDVRDVGPVVEAIGDAQIVLLGESTHGTHEFYRLRAEITRRLLVERGFDAVAVEADWPDALGVSRWVQREPQAGFDDDPLAGFARFPRWMWRNREVLAFVRWLRRHNEAIADAGRRIGFYGLDLYSLRRSMEAVLRYLERTDAAAAREARRRYDCFAHLADEPQRYGQATRFGRMPDCEREVLAQFRALMQAAPQGAPVGDELFYAQQNARLVRNAEQYYRVMFEGEVPAWNLRDRHMADVLEALVDHQSVQRRRAARVVVWAHHSHIGDARATEMGERGELNLGQLMRERYPGACFLLGFTTHAGHVAAASDWDEPVECKRIVPSRADSIERRLHESGVGGDAEGEVPDTYPFGM
ncbi:erythromycin esterase family protein [Schlegelella aquatica]|uniref:erythromycin esterase family protein n=1 Tax=Caldimonas aquatica TaxID=376175 RepID=UPI003752972B